jgi:tetratricopeptide (TPR) repeat protein
MECNVYNREDYGGFWRRSFADFFDGIFLAIAYAVVIAISGARPIVVLLVFLAYMVGFKVYGGATPGYRILGLRIVSINGTEIAVKQALVRALSSIFSGLAFGLGFIWIAIDENKQAWHDKAAGTYVIRSGANPVRTVEIPQTRLIRGKLFAVLFLGILVVLGFSDALFRVEPHQQAVVTEFGVPKRSVLPGLHLKIPFTQDVRYFDMRVQELHLPTVEAQMSDLTRISIDATASYQIVDCVRFYPYSRDGFPDIFRRTLILTLREILGRYSLTDLSDKRDKILEDVKAQMTPVARRFGTRLIDINLFFSKQAISDYTKAMEIDPEYAILYYHRGIAYHKKGQYEKAISDYTKAIEINPEYAGAYNDLAWILATCPDAEYRDGVKAVELAQKVVELNPKAWYLDTLAAAYAEAGKFEDAITTQEKAIALLKKEEGGAERLVELMERLNSYKAHKPWRKK